MELKIVAFDITNLNKNLDLSKINKNYIIDNKYYHFTDLHEVEKSEYKGPKTYNQYIITYENSDDYIYLKSFGYEPIDLNEVELAPILVFEAQEYKNGDFKSKNIYFTIDSQQMLFELDSYVYHIKKRQNGIITQTTGYDRNKVDLFIILNNERRNLDKRFTAEEYTKVKKEIKKFNKVIGQFNLELAIKKLTYEFNDTIINSEFVY